MGSNTPPPISPTKMPWPAPPAQPQGEVETNLDGLARAVDRVGDGLQRHELRLAILLARLEKLEAEVVRLRALVPPASQP